jgi:hypothetical protein
LSSSDDVGIVTRLAHYSNGLRGSHRSRTKRTVQGYNVVVLRMLRQRSSDLLLLLLLTHSSRR